MSGNNKGWHTETKVTTKSEDILAGGVDNGRLCHYGKWALWLMSMHKWRLVSPAATMTHVAEVFPPLGTQAISKWERFLDLFCRVEIMHGHI